VDETGKLKYKIQTDAPEVKEGWTSTVKDAKRGPHQLDNAHESFHGKIDAIIIPPGTTLYRVLDPKSADNRICWMSKEEFEKLKSKDDWRRKFAVWANWNSNGEFVTYVVPPGKGLHVWEGMAASQGLKGTKYVLEGGARQIVLNPADLDKGMLGKRQKTNWVYGLENESNLIGAPVLTNNWYVKESK
jgi:hypothetical protein